jgi:Rrf2 family transcriptional regulator, iron-sulfur cluster assembly transcription factor
VATSEQQPISFSCFEQLFAKLCCKSSVEAVRGPGGGYNLSPTMDLISVLDMNQCQKYGHAC